MSGENYDDGFWKGVESRDDEVETLQAELAAAKAGAEALRAVSQKALAYMESVGNLDMYPDEYAIVEQLRAALKEKA
jgi:hypothetical protein